MANENTAPIGKDVAESFVNSIRLNENQFNEAMARGDAQAALEARNRGALLYAQALVLSGNQALLKEMMQVSPNVLKKVAEELNAGGIDAFKKMIDLQNAANQKKQEMYMDEINRMYQSRLATAEGPARLMASFKGFAMLLQAFGFDCSDFIKECDRRIEEEYAKVPKKDIEGISKLNAFTIDPSQAAQAVHIMKTEAQKVAREIPGAIQQSTQDADQGARMTLNGGPTTSAGGRAQTPPVATLEPVDTGLVVTAMEKIIAEKKLITADKSTGLKAELESGITAAARIDKNAKTISAEEMDALAINTQSAIKSRGGQVNMDEATKLAKDAIERARIMSLAGAPSPQPS